VYNFVFFYIGYNKLLICGEDEQYTTCVNPCQPSCEEPYWEPCQIKKCLNGCICQEKYRQATTNMHSPCIAFDEECTLILVLIFIYNNQINKFE